MITSRGWWFLLVVMSVLTIGLFDERWTLTLLGFTLLLWFLGEWLLFGLRVRLAVPALRLERQIADDQGPVASLWARHTFQVRLKLVLDHWLGLPYVRVRDRLPYGARRTSGEEEGQAALYPGAPFSLNYAILCPSAGRVRFEGVALQLADFQGFFYHAAFVPGTMSLRVLPPLADAEGHRPTVKRHNLLPSPGLHRHLRPGSGSELLDLRDYLPGDPPKTIAWKVSARRDRLITKEFESEVPLRCTLFVDVSQAVRLGPPGQNALARLVDISATTAQATAASRDLIGLCLFDDAQVRSLTRPARGSRHLVQLLNLLADAAGLAPATGQARVETLLLLAHAFAQEVYPSYLRQESNQVPAWLPWFWSIPAAGPTRSSFFKHILRWLLLALAFLPVAAAAWLVYLFSDPLAQILLPVPERLLPVLGVAFAASFGMIYYLLANVGFRATALFFARRRRRLARQRKQLAALLAVEYNLGPGGLSLLLEDDEQFVRGLQDFLADHHVPYPLPLYDRHGRYLFASPGKVPVLARALLSAVGKGHDNELFVLLVDLLELSEHLDPLLRAVKATLARHHQVVVICPWPPGVPPPRRQSGKSSPAATAPGAGLQDTLRQVTVARYHAGFQQLRTTFARIGVPVICAESGDPVRLLLDRLDRMRALGMGRKR